MNHRSLWWVAFSCVLLGACDSLPVPGDDTASTPAPEPVAPPAPPVALPGNCVAVPSTPIALMEHRSAHGYDRYQQKQLDFEKDFSWRFETLYDLDLDLDGTMDARVPIAVRGDATCPTEIGWDLYVVRGPCGHFVGRVAGNPKGPDEPMGEIQVREEPQGPQDNAVTRTYALQQGLYAEATKDVHRARCDVHPADCQPMTRFECHLVPHGEPPTP